MQKQIYKSTANHDCLQRKLQLNPSGIEHNNSGSNIYYKHALKQKVNTNKEMRSMQH